MTIHKCTNSDFPFQMVNSVKSVHFCENGKKEGLQVVIQYNKKITNLQIKMLKSLKLSIAKCP